MTMFYSTFINGCRGRPNDAFCPSFERVGISGCTTFFDAFFLLIFYDTLIYLFTMGVKWLIDVTFWDTPMVGSKSVFRKLTLKGVRSASKFPGKNASRFPDNPVKMFPRRNVAKFPANHAHKFRNKSAHKYPSKSAKMFPVRNAETSPSNPASKSPKSPVKRFINVPCAHSPLTADSSNPPNSTCIYHQRAYLA